jgi:hypothetical protein
MGETCPDCGQPFGMSRRPVETTTGRHVCADCRDRTLAAAAGVVANPGNEVAGAIATEGWFTRIRRGLRSAEGHRSVGDAESRGVDQQDRAHDEQR